MRVLVIDAFTDRPFTGNPAGVCLLDGGPWPDDAWMRGLAGELSLETAFARPLPGAVPRPTAYPLLVARAILWA